MSEYTNDLIFDLGMNDGSDAHFYLEKGFRVVAVEANPELVRVAREKLAGFIAQGQLIIEPIAIGTTEGKAPFYLNKDNDLWSSLKQVWGARQDSDHTVIEVDCRLPGYLFEKYGMPYYLKIDIEGSDIDVVRALGDFDERPRFLSIEENRPEFFVDLHVAGYDSFKLVSQRGIETLKCPDPPLEGRYVNWTFPPNGSGPFGEETPGQWMDWAGALEKYFETVRSPSRGYQAGGNWFDIHARSKLD